MGSRKYQLQIILRIVLIVANSYAIAYMWMLQKYWFTFGNLVALLVIQTILMIRYLSRWQNDLKVFANSVTHGDYSISYHMIKPGDDHYEVYSMLNRISEYVREIRAQYIQQTLYFRHVVENVQIGLMVHDEKGKVVFINRECLELIGKKDIGELDELARTDERLFSELKSLPVGQPVIISSIRDRLVKLSARKSTILIDGKPLHLLSLANIREEIEATELQSWQDLISVLTHEIMNSVTPIHSLSGSMSKYLDKIEGNQELVEKAQNSLGIINRRSHGLMNFVARYRAVSAVPLPVLQPVNLDQLIQSVLKLLEDDLGGVQVMTELQNSLIRGDAVQLEQVFINLIKNSVHAMSGSQEKILTIKTKLNDGLTVMIADTGIGIDPEIREKIFVPFFTTRQGGSGIGLTLSRQIMQRHGGTITVESNDGGGTVFQLYFPKNLLQ